MVREVWGRESELTAAARALDLVPLQPAILSIGGEAGIGKTTIWKACVSLADDKGYRVLSARPAEAEATFAFAAVADLLHGCFEEVARELPTPQLNALGAALLREDQVVGPRSPDPKAVAFGLYGGLLALSRSRPLVIAVDDVDWLDASSARVLGFAIRRIEDAPVAFILAIRGDGDAGRSDPLGLQDAALEERLHRIDLGPLGPEALRQVLRSRLNVRFPDWVLGELYRSSGGNPFLASELARALLRRGGDLVPGQPLPVPDRLTELVAERLEGLPAAMRTTLLLVSASSWPTMASLARAAGDPVRFRADIEAADRSELVEVADDRVRFVEPLLGSVLYAQASAKERRHVHQMLADAAANAEERARHLALAADGPDDDIAQALEDAAQLARSRGAPDAAAQLAELARALTPSASAEARTRRTSAAGRHAFESAQIERAEAFLTEAAASSAGPMRAEALLYLSRVRYHRQDTSATMALAEEALREAKDDRSLQAGINLELATAAEVSGDHRAARRRARQAVRLAEGSGDRTITAEALSVSAFYEFESGSAAATELIERAGSLQGSDPPVRPLRGPGFYRALMFLWSDDLAEARSQLAHLEQRARDTGDEGSLSVLLALLSQIDSWEGRWAEAVFRAEESRTLAEWTGQRIYLAHALYAAALVAGLRGEVDRASALAEESLQLAERSGSAQTGELASSVLGSLALSRDDPREADRWLSELVDAAERRGAVEPGMLWFLPDEIEALIALGEISRAEAVLDRFEARARARGRARASGAAARCRGLVLASRRELDAATAAFGRALEHQGDLGQPMELGRTYFSMGTALRRGKRWAPAREALGRALRIFDGLGASVWADRARSELARVGGRAPSPFVLTETEMRVAELVSTGLTNREAAARLFLSVSTVESNLRRAYRKLGVRSRAELSYKLGGVAVGRNNDPS